MQDAAAVAGLARVLGDETRVRLLDELTSGEASVSALACRLGLDQPLERGWLRAEGERVELTPAGEAALAAEGVDVAEARRARRAFAVGCLDWTERRHHLGGALGAAVLRRLLAGGRARLRPGSRVVHMQADA